MFRSESNRHDFTQSKDEILDDSNPSQDVVFDEPRQTADFSSIKKQTSDLQESASIVQNEEKSEDLQDGGQKLKI